MFNFLKKSDLKEDHSKNDSFLKAESQLEDIETSYKEESENETFENSYNSEKNIIENRFSLLNQSYNKLFTIEKEKRTKQKTPSRKNSSTKRSYKLPIVRIQTKLEIPFSINNLDSYFAEAIHGITAKNIIDEEIQNELTDIRLQMACAEKNLSIDRRKFDQPIKAANRENSSNYLPPIPTKKSQDILEDVFTELDSLLAGEKAYFINGKASIVRNKKKSKRPNQLKKAINNIRL